MKSIISKKFIECLDVLKSRNTINSDKRFAEALEYTPQSLSEIRKGNRDIPLEIMRKAVVIFRFNPVYLCTGEGPMFLNDDNPTGLQVLSIVTDEHNNEKIVHVPVPAQAGYVQDLSDTQYIGNLPSYSLPEMEFTHGTFRSFDVDGESMEPTLKSGDKVICKYIEREFWFTDIKENNIYVVVSQDGIVVKRIQNRLRNRTFIRLISDNPSFDSYELPGPEIKEIWRVEYRITELDHNAALINGKSPVLTEIEALNKSVQENNQELSDLKNLLSSMMNRSRPRSIKR